MVRGETERLLPREHVVAVPAGHTAADPMPGAVELEEEAPYAPLTPSERRSLVFLQMNTPLSVLFCVVTAIVGVMVVPSLDDVFNSHPTLMTTSPRMFLGYMFVLLLFQVGFCMLAVVTHNAHTQRCIVETTGSRLAVENYMLALWFVMFILDTTTTTAVGCYALGGVGVLSLVNAAVLQARYKPRWVHPFELLLVHVPNKLITVLVVYQLFWQQLFLDANWVRDPWRGYDHLHDSFWYAIAIEVVLGILLAIWVGVNGDVAVYASSIYLDIAVLSLRSIPTIGPRSRPFSLSIIIFVSMAVRTGALVVPGLLRNKCLFICHAHPGGGEAHAVEPAEQPPSQAEEALQAAYADQRREGPQLDAATVQRTDPSYGSLHST